MAPSHKNLDFISMSMKEDFLAFPTRYRLLGQASRCQRYDKISVTSSQFSIALNGHKGSSCDQSLDGASKNVLPGHNVLYT